MCLTSGVTPAFSANATASVNAASWAATDGMPGDIGAGEVRPQAHHLYRAAGLGVQGGLDQPRPVRRRSAAPAQPGVGLEVQPGPDADPVGRGRDLRGERDRAGRDVDVVPDRLGGIAEGHQAQHRDGDARLAERDGLGQVGDAQPAGPAGQRRAGGRHHAVAVPAGLHHGHHLAAAHQFGQRRDVPGDRAEVDESLPVHRAHRLRNASGRARTRSEAPIGASATSSLRLVPSGLSGALRDLWAGPAAASRPAMPCR